MANYNNVIVSGTLPASGLVYADYSAKSSWITHGRDIDVGLAAPTDKTYTEYKLWGYGAFTGEGDASWITIPASGTIDVTLDDETNVQTLRSRFRDASQSESGVITASGITFSFTDPSKSAALSWIGLTDENDTSIILRNTSDNIDLTLDKTKINDLKYDSRDFSGVSINNDIITVTSGSDIWKMIENDSTALVPIKKTYVIDNIPFIRVDVNDGTGFKTLTKYDGTIRSDITGDYLNRIESYSYSSGSKELTFNIKKFSQYGFATINNLKFESDSTTAGYINTSITLKVGVYDTNGEGVESAPVTISGTGTVIGNFSSNPVNTNSAGIATFTLNLDTLGSATYDASCDNVHTTSDQITWCLAVPNAERSFLEQPTQLDKTLTYDDSISGINTSAVAEPVSVSGTLEKDLNNLRTLVKDIKGTTYWYDDLGTYFDPTSTTSGSTNSKDLNLANIAGNTLDSHTIILAVEADNSGAGFTVSGTDTGVLYSTGLSYATNTNRLGLPVFASSANPGVYWDEGGSDDVCVIDLIDTSTGGEFKNSSGHLVYAKFHDGADFSGAGTGTDIYVRFYANNTPYTWTASDPTSIMMVFPYRRRLVDMEEYQWTRTDFVNGFEGDVDLIDDIVNLWDFTGATNNVTDPTWTNVSGSYVLDTNPTDLEAATDLLNTEIGNRTYTTTSGSHYLTDGEDITASLDALSEGVISNDSDISTNAGNISTLQSDMTAAEADITDLEAATGTTTGLAGLDYSSNNYVTDATSLETAIGVLDSAISGGSGDKYIEQTASNITANVEHTLPYGITYTPYSTSQREGNNMDVWLEGQLLAADTGANGANADRDYGETTTSGITFRFNIPSGSNIIYVVRQ